VRKLVNRLKKRFAGTHPTLVAYRVFIPDPSMLDFDGEKRILFGKAEMDQLFAVYSDVLNLSRDLLLNEWSDFKVCVYILSIVHMLLFKVYVHRRISYFLLPKSRSAIPCGMNAPPPAAITSNFIPTYRNCARFC